MTNGFIQSSNLYTPPSFFKGMARVFDLFGTLDRYYIHKTEEEADSNALRRDWQIVGKDIFYAIKIYESSKKKSR